jgi:hypothetical protein
MELIDSALDSLEEQSATVKALLADLLRAQEVSRYIAETGTLESLCDDDDVIAGSESEGDAAKTPVCVCMAAVCVCIEIDSSRD